MTAQIEAKHKSEWIEKSGVSPEITTQTIVSVSDRKQIRKFLGWKQYPSKHPLGWIAYSGEFDGTRSEAWGQFKPDEPVSLNGKDAKYLTPSVAAVSADGEKVAQDCFILPTRSKEEWDAILGDASVAIAITEGFKKLAKLETEGIVGIGVTGVNRWHEKDEPYKLYPKLKALAVRGRKFDIYYDADWSNNPTVRQQMLLLGEVLGEFGCTVVYKTWELTDATKGIDDLCVAFPDTWGDYITDTTFDQLREIHQELDKEAGKQRKKVVDDIVADFEGFKQKYGYNQLKIKFEEDSEGNLHYFVPMREFFSFSKEFTGRIRYNQMLDDYEFDGQPVDWNTIRLDLEAWGFDLSFQKAEEYVRKVGDKDCYSPARDYLNSLPPGDPNYLNELASKYFGVPVTDTLSMMYLRKWLIGAVRRAMEPGTLMDCMIVLIGKQGCGKSQFFRRLASENFFTDTFGVGADVGNKDELSKLREHWILELGELDYLFSRSQTEQFKRFLSTTKDCYRRSYGRGNKSYPRGCAFAGTSNQRELLKDETGNRRYFVVEIPDGWKIPFMLLDNDRNKIWAAAVTAYRNEESHFLLKEHQEALSQRNEQFQSTDPWQDIIEDWLRGEGQQYEYFQGFFVLERVLKLDPAHMNQQAQNRLSRILSCLGWVKKKKKVDSKSIQVWVPGSGLELIGSGYKKNEGGTSENLVNSTISDIGSGVPGSSYREENNGKKDEKDEKVDFKDFKDFDNFSKFTFNPPPDPEPGTNPQNTDTVSVLSGSGSNGNPGTNSEQGRNPGTQELPKMFPVGRWARISDKRHPYCGDRLIIVGHTQNHIHCQYTKGKKQGEDAFMDAAEITLM